MKSKIISFLIISVLLIGAVLLGFNITNQQVKQKDSQIAHLQKEKADLKATNDRLSETVKRQSKTVIAEDEKRIRETAQSFVKAMFEMKKGTSFQEKSATLKPFVTDEYHNTLFGNVKDKYNLFDDITVSDINVYFDTYDPKKDDYKVFVQFNERLDTEASDKVENSVTSVQLDLVRTGDGWKINDLQRFNLKPLGY
ncbi:hypothetical protein TP70_03460 [Staphylococcus microti]|uniref:Transposon-related protein n=1 Tax=Staphylococcus microti TaxID=569857 RepID=A0A0D6XQZ1_9STAP|nr:TMF family protein [Staphylococcus microti]KIX91229.1 hypothetical protein TP70_03460 [Staphylococcus microti]PNZ75783.1 hypothetical protein CD132_12110 [Staphylococcus microti]SUM58295.1 transposon-related protein [Staphylococcus microti]